MTKNFLSSRPATVFIEEKKTRAIARNKMKRHMSHVHFLSNT